MSVNDDRSRRAEPTAERPAGGDANNTRSRGLLKSVLHWWHGAWAATQVLRQVTRSQFGVCETKTLR